MRCASPRAVPVATRQGRSTAAAGDWLRDTESGDTESARWPVPDAESRARYRPVAEPFDDRSM